MKNKKTIIISMVIIILGILLLFLFINRTPKLEKLVGEKANNIVKKYKSEDSFNCSLFGINGVVNIEYTTLKEVKHIEWIASGIKDVNKIDSWYNKAINYYDKIGSSKTPNDIGYTTSSMLKVINNKEISIFILKGSDNILLMISEN